MIDGQPCRVMDFTHRTPGNLRAFVQVEWLDGRPIAIELPSVIELKVVETSPVMKTATKTASTKPAKLSNGVTVQVPEFISAGEKVRVDPRSGQYLERAK